eukprot:1157457-Pelagomonas_calceolata.AAC.6
MLTLEGRVLWRDLSASWLLLCLLLSKPAVEERCDWGCWLPRLPGPKSCAACTNGVVHRCKSITGCACRVIAGTEEKCCLKKEAGMSWVCPLICTAVQRCVLPTLRCRFVPASGNIR